MKDLDTILKDMVVNYALVAEDSTAKVQYLSQHRTKENEDAYQWAMYDQDSAHYLSDMASRFYRIFMSVKGCEDPIKEVYKQIDWGDEEYREITLYLLPFLKDYYNTDEQGVYDHIL